MHPDPALQREYDNRALVPEHQAIIAGWYADAAAFRASAPHAECDLAYGAGERERLDLFWPDASRTARIALFIHGGYWQALDRRACSHFAVGLNARGLGVAIPSYDLCPAVGIPDILAQLRAACRWLWRRHGRPFVVSGHSAGGQLAAMLLATDWPAEGAPDGLVAAAVPISGVFDLEPLRRTTIGDALHLDAATARSLSPQALASPGRPVHAFVGAAESAAFRGQTSAFAAAWGGTATELAGHNHFTILAELTDKNGAVVHSIAVAASTKQYFRKAEE